MGPDALIKSKIKQTRFRWGRGGADMTAHSPAAKPRSACSPCTVHLQLGHTLASFPLLPSLRSLLCREGYEEGLSTTHKVLSAAAFIAGDSPIEQLGQFTAIALEGPNSLGEPCCCEQTAALFAATLSLLPVWLRAAACILLGCPGAHAPPRDKRDDAQTIRDILA